MTNDARTFSATTRNFCVAVSGTRVARASKRAGGMPFDGKAAARVQMDYDMVRRDPRRIDVRYCSRVSQMVLRELQVTATVVTRPCVIVNDVTRITSDTCAWARSLSEIIGILLSPLP